MRVLCLVLLLSLLASVSAATTVSLDSSTTLLDSSIFTSGATYAAVFQLTGSGFADTQATLSLFQLDTGTGLNQSGSDPVFGSYVVGPNTSLASGIWQAGGTLGLSVTPSDSYALYSQTFTAGSTFGFDFQLTTDLIPGYTPDQFAFQLYDSTYSTLLYEVAVDAPATDAPEPGSWSLALICGAAAALWGLRRRRPFTTNQGATMNRRFLAITLFATAFSTQLTAQSNLIATLNCVERPKPVAGNTALNQTTAAGNSQIMVTQAIPYNSSVTINPGGPTQEAVGNAYTLSGGPPYTVFLFSPTQYAHTAGEVIAFQSLPVSAAYFGYTNTDSTPVSEAAGSINNFLLPGRPNVGQPSLFQPGAYPRVFSAGLYPGRDLIWILTTQESTARETEALYCDTPIPTIQVDNLTVAANTVTTGVRLGSASWSGTDALTVSTGEIFYLLDLTGGAVPTTDVTITNLAVQNGIITGDVTAGSGAIRRIYGYTLAVTTASGVKNFSTGLLEVVTPCAMTVAPPVLPTAVVGSAYSTTFSATGGPAPISYAVEGGLPLGVALNGAVLSGTPQQSGSYPFLLKASGVDGCFQRSAYTLSVQAATCAGNVTTGVQVTMGGFRQNLATKQWQQTVTLRNATASAISGPVALALDSLSANAALVNGSGVTTCAGPLGSPYVLVDVGSDSALTAGETASATLTFSNSNPAIAITYTPRVLAGGNTR